MKTFFLDGVGLFPHKKLRGINLVPLFLLAEKWQVHVKFGFSLNVFDIMCVLMDIGSMKSYTKNPIRVTSEMKILLRGGGCHRTYPTIS